jgi:tetratricopeptide (TPR) repeat protein
MIGKYKGLLGKRPSFAILDHWTQKAELDINRGRHQDAVATLLEVSKALTSSGYTEEMVRVGKKLMNEVEWTEACVSYRDFDEFIHQIINSMTQLGQFSEADRCLSRYEGAIPGQSAQYINLCDLRCYHSWYQLRYEESISWGERGEQLRVRSKVDTKYSAEHNLALARRDSGSPEAALQYFLRGQSLDDIFNAEKPEAARGGQYYGNIGRCLHLAGRVTEALVAYRKSATLLEDDQGEHAETLNRGYIRQWIGEALLTLKEHHLAKMFLAGAICQWWTFSPPRAKSAVSILERIDPELLASLDSGTETHIAAERAIRQWIGI